MRLLSIVLLLLCVNVIAEVFPVYDELFEYDVVPEMGKGLVYFDYQRLNPTGYLHKGEHYSYADWYTCNYYQNMNLTEIVGVGENLYIGAKLLYEVNTSRTIYEHTDGVGKTIKPPYLFSKWNFINNLDTLRLGVMIKLELPTNYSHEIYVPTLLVATGAPIGPGRLMMNAGYTYYDAYTGGDNRDIVTYGLSYQIRLSPTLCLPVDVLGRYNLKYKPKGDYDSPIPDYNQINAATSISVMPIGEHWAANIGCIVPIVKPYTGLDYDFSPRGSITYYF